MRVPALSLLVAGTTTGEQVLRGHTLYLLACTHDGAVQEVHVLLLAGIVGSRCSCVGSRCSCVGSRCSCAGVPPALPEFSSSTDLTELACLAAGGRWLRHKM